MTLGWILHAISLVQNDMWEPSFYEQNQNCNAREEFYPESRSCRTFWKASNCPIIFFFFSAALAMGYKEMQDQPGCIQFHPKFGIIFSGWSQASHLTSSFIRRDSGSQGNLTKLIKVEDPESPSQNTKLYITGRWYWVQFFFCRVSMYIISHVTGRWCMLSSELK